MEKTATELLLCLPQAPPSVAYRSASTHADADRNDREAIMAQHRSNEASRRLETIPGIGAVGATAIAARRGQSLGEKHLRCFHNSTLRPATASRLRSVGCREASTALAFRRSRSRQRKNPAVWCGASRLGWSTLWKGANHTLLRLCSLVDGRSRRTLAPGAGEACPRLCVWQRPSAWGGQKPTGSALNDKIALARCAGSIVWSKFH
jgi:hypothetical protein